MQKSSQNTPDKKALSLEIQNQIAQSLSHLKELWGEKKFNNKVEEAAKLFTKGFKKQEQPKKSVKKEKEMSVKSKATAEKKTVKKEEKKQKAEIIPEVISAPKKQSPQKAARKSAAKKR
jgi:hypothetical protein